jgi:hypothetical protein
VVPLSLLWVIGHNDMAIILNLLQITQTICDELGLNRPAVDVNSTDTQIRQIYSLINRSIRELQQNYDWTVLQTEYDLHVSQPTITVGDVALGSYQIINIPTTSFMPALKAPNWTVNAQYVPVAARVVSVDSPTQVTISEPANGTLVGGQVTFAQDTYPEPNDFSRFINQTWWDRTNRWSLMGPDSPQIDQWHRSGIVTIGPRRHFRQIGWNSTLGDFNQFDFNNPDFNTSGTPYVYRIWPAPGATDTPLDLVYEYISANIVISNLMQPQSFFVADTDMPLIYYQMLVIDTKWRLWQIKGFDYLPLQMEARDYIDRCYANDGGAKTLSLSNKRASYWLSTGYTPDGNWPGPTSSGV